MIKEELIVNISHYKKLLEPLMEKRRILISNEKDWLEEIDLNFKNTVRWLIAQELHKVLNVSIEEAFIEVESINLKEYLK